MCSKPTKMPYIFEVLKTFGFNNLQTLLRLKLENPRGIFVTFKYLIYLMLYMVDPRIKKLAEIFVNYSLKIKKGDTVEISCGPEAQALVLELSKLILQKGAVPLIRSGMPGSANVYYKYASEEILKKFPKIAMYEAKNCNAWITIGTEYNTKELSGVDPKKMAIRGKVA